MRFYVVLPRFPWWQCLEDLADCLARGLNRAGNDVVLIDAVPSGAYASSVLLGAHSANVHVPPGTIIYQTEVPGSVWFTDNYRRRLDSALAVWHAAPEFLQGRQGVVVEPGLYPTTPAHVEKDIDVLFYGSLSDRRMAMLSRIADAGLKAEAHFGVFGAKRNALIDRAKVVVDIKQHEGDPNDKTRTFFLDSRGACVLSENDSKFSRALKPDSVVDQCKRLLASDEAREAHARSRRDELAPMDLTSAIAQLSITKTNGTAHHPV